MPPQKYLTVSEDLIPCANATARYFRQRGYKLRVEPQELEYPYRPTFVGKRHPTTLVIEVAASIPLDRVEQWVRYGKSVSRDTRIAFCLPEPFQVPPSSIAILVARGVGLYRSGVGNFYEVLSPHDLSVQVQLPELDTLPPPLRAMLGPVYDKFDRGDWREGFGEACHILETEAKKYLKAGIRSGRITALDKRGNVKNPKMSAIEKMTLGQLASVFLRVRNQNYTDSVLAGTLPRINPDRIGVVHKKRSRRTEDRLRGNVGRNMWTVINCLREIKN